MLKGGEFVQKMYKGIFGSSYYYDNYVEETDIDTGYSIFNIYDIDNDDIDNDFNCKCKYKDDEYNEECNKENCVTCYYSNGKYCSLKNINIDEYSPICWCYRDSITMQPYSDF